MRRVLKGGSHRAILIAALAGALAGARDAGAAPPTPAQVAALGELEREAAVYEGAARDYRGVLTRIVQHHYEDRRRPRAGRRSTPRSPSRRRACTTPARRRSAGSRPSSPPTAARTRTPRARPTPCSAWPPSTRSAPAPTEGDAERGSAAGLEAGDRALQAHHPRVPRSTASSAGIYYYLGHAYNDSSRLPEAQQVWRSLVCHNQYTYPTRRRQGSRQGRRSASARPRSRLLARVGGAPSTPTAAAGRRQGAPSARPRPGRGARGRGNTRSTTRSPSEPSTRLQAHPAEDRRRAPSRATSPRSGGSSATTTSTRSTRPAAPSTTTAPRPPTAGDASSRSRRSTAWRCTSSPGPTSSSSATRPRPPVRRPAPRTPTSRRRRPATPAPTSAREAYTYIAGSLTYLDFAGPGADEPYVPRSDILDAESDSHVAEQKMRVAIERVQDPKLIPQDEKWTVDVYKALAQEFKELNQLHNTIEVDELILKRWPMHRDAPVDRRTRSRTSTTSSPSIARGHGASGRENVGARARAPAPSSRPTSATRPGSTPTTTIREAIQTADRLVHGGLPPRRGRSHQRGQRALSSRRIGIGDKESRDPLLERALTEYKLAAQGWDGYLKQDVNAPDAYESRYWLADADHNVVVILVSSSRRPAQRDRRRAPRGDRRARLQRGRQVPAARGASWSSTPAQQVLERPVQALRPHARARRASSRATASGPPARATASAVVEEPAAPAGAPTRSRRATSTSSASRPPSTWPTPPRRADPAKNADLFRYQAADDALRLRPARRRPASASSPSTRASAARARAAYKAWRRLLEHRRPRARRRAQRHPRPGRAEEELRRRLRGPGRRPRRPRHPHRHRLRERRPRPSRRRSGCPTAPARRPVARRRRRSIAPRWRSDPRRRRARGGDQRGLRLQAGRRPRAGHRACTAVRQGVRQRGDLGRAGEGRRRDEPAQAGRPESYAERMGYLEQAYGGLAPAYALVFDYRRAAATYNAVAENARFRAPPAPRGGPERRPAARQPRRSRAARGRPRDAPRPRPSRREAGRESTTRSPSPSSAAGTSTGSTRAPTAPRASSAMAAMEAYHAENQGNAAARVHTVRAAHAAAKLRRAGRDPRAAEWCHSTVAAFDRLRAGSRVVEGRTRRSARPRPSWPPSARTGCSTARSRPTSPSRAPAVRGDASTRSRRPSSATCKKAEAHAEALQGVITSYASRSWSAEARARQASLYDACRTGLYWAGQPAVKLFTAREERLLTAAERSDNPQVQAQADEFRQKRREDWRDARARLLEDADRRMIKGYVEATLWARAWKTKGPAVDAALQRLAFFTPVLGDARLRASSAGVVDPETQRPFEYRDGLFLTLRPGLPLAQVADGLPAPRPALP